MGALEILAALEVVIRLVSRLSATEPAIREILERASNGETITNEELDAGITKVQQASDRWDASVTKAQAKNSTDTPGGITPSE